MNIFTMRWTATIAISMIAVITLCAHYVHIEHPAYIWDYAAYWGTFKGYSFWLSSSPLDAIASIAQETRTADYNPTPIIALFPFYLLFGDGRAAYIIGIAITYVLPASVVAMLLSARIANVRPTVSLFIICATVPAFWVATLRGQPDIVGLIFLGTATILLFKSNYLTHKPLLYGLTIGLCTYAPFLFRRWYAYSVVLFFAASLLFSMIHAMKSNEFLKTYFKSLAGIAFSGFTVLFLLIAFQFELVIRISETSYATLYNAYQTNFLQHIRGTTQYSSYFALIITAIGISITFRNINIEAIFCIVAALGTFIVFIQTQYMGPHHILPVYMWMIPPFAIGVIWICEKIKIHMRYAAVLSLVILITSTLPISKNLGIVGSILLPRVDMTPLYLANFGEYQRLVSELGRLTRDDKTVVVYASSVHLSDSLLVSLDPSLQRAIVFAPHIAAVQGFPPELLNADYAVVATPDQYHLRPGTQENILQPGRWILRGIGFGQAYERLAEFNLQHGVTAFIYARNRPVTGEEKFELLDELAKLYPDMSELFARPVTE